MNNFNFKKLIPHLVAIIIFLVVTFAYLNPLLKGKALKMSDISNFQGMSKELADFREANNEEALWTNSMFSGMPAFQISVAYPSNLLKYIDNLFMLYLPRPADYLFLCMLGFYFLMCVLKVDRWLGVVGAIAYALCSYYIISLEVGHTSKAHAIAYIAPILASFIITYRGKYLLGGALTALFLGLQLYCNHLQITYYTVILIGIYVVTEAIGAAKENGIPNFLKASLVVAAATLLAALPNVGNLWFSYDYGKYTTRGKSELTIPSPADIQDKAKAAKNNQTGGLPRDYITGWSYGVSETFTLLIPNYKGGESDVIYSKHKDLLKKVDNQYKNDVAGKYTYFGEQPFTAGPTYAGAIIMFLFVIGALFYKGRLKWALLIATGISIMFAWGSNFQGLSDFLIDYLPGYNKFRSVSMTMTIANFTIPALALLGLYKIINTENFLLQPFTLFGKQLGTNQRAFIFSFVITGGLCFLMYAMPTLFNNFSSGHDVADSAGMVQRGEATEEQAAEIYSYVEDIRIAIFKADALRSGLLILVSAIALFLFFRLKYDRRILISILGILIVFDLATIDMRFMDKESFTSKKEAKIPFPKNKAIISILEDKDPDFRTLNLTANTFNDASTSYYVKSIGGYHGAKLKRYQQLIEFRISEEMGIIGNGFNQINEAMKSARNNAEADSIYRMIINKTLYSIPTLNMLNTKYIIVNPNSQAMLNPFAYGNAWFVKDVQMVANPDSEILALNKINPKVTAAIDKQYEAEVGGFKPVYDSNASIKLTSYKANALAYESNAATEQLAVFSEIYYKDGWNAYVDGKVVPHFRADFVLRAMKVPAGKHKIEFKFEPAPYATGEKVAFAGSILLYLIIAGAIFMEVRKKQTAEGNA